MSEEQLCRECGINPTNTPSAEGDCEYCADTRIYIKSISDKINFMVRCGLLSLLNDKLSKHRVAVIRYGQKCPTVSEVSLINVIWIKYNMDAIYDK